jgi:hypothetical protein
MQEAAESSSAEAAAPSDESAPAEVSEGPGLEEIRSWAGYKLDEIGGASVGKVAGAYLDEVSGRPEWLVARLGRFGHHTVVPARDAVAGVGRVWVPYPRDHIRRAPKIQAGTPLTGEQEATLLAHYGVAGPAGRSAEVAGRDAGTVTSRPAD